MLLNVDCLVVYFVLCIFVLLLGPCGRNKQTVPENSDSQLHARPPLRLPWIGLCISSREKGGSDSSHPSQGFSRFFYIFLTRNEWFIQCGQTQDIHAGVGARSMAIGIVRADFDPLI